MVSPPWEKHLRLLAHTFAALQNAGVAVKPSNARFGSKQVRYLDHVMSDGGITTGNDRTEAIEKLHNPKNLKMSRYCVRYYGHITCCAPVRARLCSSCSTSGSAFTNKDYGKVNPFQEHWGNLSKYERCPCVKEELSSPPVLHFPHFSKDFVVHLDAGENGVGAFLARFADDASDRKRSECSGIL